MIGAVPQFPQIKVERQEPDILEPREVAAAFAVIEEPWDLGMFRAIYRAIRPSEARALDLTHGRRGLLRIERAMDGAEAAAGFNPTKNWQTRTIAPSEEWPRGSSGGCRRRQRLSGCLATPRYS